MSVDLRLVHTGGGNFRPRTKLDFELCLSTFDDGEMVRAKVSKARSVRQNGYFHALIQAAFENQRGGPQVETWEHLKSWLLIEAGHCDEVRINVGSMSEADAKTVAGGMARELKRRFDTVGVSYDRSSKEVVMRFARSVAFRAVDREKMGEIVDRVVAVICTVVVPGVDPETIMNQAKARAKGDT
jgi:hypothetical protein